MDKEKKELVEMERAKMQEELSILQEEFGIQAQKIRGASGYGENRLHIVPDSLLDQLGEAQAKINRLTEELRAVKDTDAKRINELSQEITSLRKVLRSYVEQIDSLQRINTELREENQKMSDHIEATEAETRKLAGEKISLTAQVARAARLEAQGLRTATLDKRGRATQRIEKIQSIKVEGTIARNVTAQPGRRVLYLRILNPNDQPLAGDGAAFSYEGSTLHSSASKEIEYGGEDLPFVLYWNVAETLLVGTYRVELFADGSLVGRTSFTLRD
ncbi:hypothetical protein [Porphyromonas endodontalis]